MVVESMLFFLRTRKHSPRSVNKTVPPCASFRSQVKKWVIATEIFYNAAITTIKLSILLLYARLFPFPHLKRIIWSVSGFVVACWLTIILLTVFQCRPIRAAWDISVKGHCLRLNVAYIVLGTCNTITDMIALCLPMPLIWRLQTDKPRKVQLICVFSLGGL